MPRFKARYTSGNSAAPGKLVYDYFFPSVKTNTAIFQKSLQHVFISLSLTSKRALVFNQLTEKQSLCQTFVGHSEHVPCILELEALEKRMNVHYNQLHFLTLQNVKKHRISIHKTKPHFITPHQNPLQCSSTHHTSLHPTMFHNLTTPHPSKHTNFTQS